MELWINIFEYMNINILLYSCSDNWYDWYHNFITIIDIVDYFEWILSYCFC